MQTMYVGVENEEASGHALRWAVDLAESIGGLARVHAVHVVRTAPAGFLGLPSHVPSSVDQERDKTAERRLGALVDEMAQGPSIELEAQVAEGDPAEVLLDLAEHADLLVLGTTTKGRITRVVMGSTSQHCVAAGTVPVAIIPR